MSEKTYDEMTQIGMNLSRDKGDHFEVRKLSEGVIAVEGTKLGMVVLAAWVEHTKRAGYSSAPVPATIAMLNEFAKMGYAVVGVVAKTMQTTMTAMPPVMLPTRVAAESFAIACVCSVAEQTWKASMPDQISDERGVTLAVLAASIGETVGKVITDPAAMAGLSTEVAAKASTIVKEALDSAKAPTGPTLSDEDARRILRGPRGQA